MNPYLIDLHEDISFYFLINPSFKDFSVRDEDRHGDIPSYRDANLKIVVGAIFPMTRGISSYGEDLRRMYMRKGLALGTTIPFAPLANLMVQLRFYHKLSEKYSNDIDIIESKSDLENIFRDNKIRILIGLEGSEAVSEPDDILMFYKMGIRLMGLTWNYDTKYAASCMSKKDYGLTGSGERLIEVMNEYGLIIDLAHTSYNTMLDVLSISKLPVVDSHTNYMSAKEHKRNIGDDVIEKLVDNKGVMGFTLIKSTIGEDNYLDKLAEHIYSVYSRFGSDVLAIGTDFFGTEPPKPLDRIDKINLLFEKLLDIGLSEGDIEKLAWKNAYRVFSENSRRWR